MPFQKHSWIKYGSQGDVVEITLKDSSGKRFDFFKCNNENDYRRVLKLVEKKMGFKSSSDKEQAEIDTQKEIETERNWLDKFS